MEKMILRSGQKVVAAAGTAEALSATNIWARCLKFVALAGNTGDAYAGDSTVDATTGLPLPAGDVVAAPGSDNPEIAVNLKNIFVDVTTNGDAVAFTYLEVTN